jgi:hypothetical protein
MASEMTTSCAMLVALGAFHGINPGMGCLFAVALGMQERRRGGVLRALVRLGAGHALAMAGAVAAALAIGAVIPIGTAHGAELMVVPVFVGMWMAHEGGHTHHMGTAAGAGTALLATDLHAVGYLAVTAFIAVLAADLSSAKVLLRRGMPVSQQRMGSSPLSAASRLE